MDDTHRTWAWRRKCKVHPAADKFDMMGDDELAKLAEDIKRNGLRERVQFWRRELIDGRNRMAAMEIAGIELRAEHRHNIDFDADPVAYIISANIRRRHLDPQQQLDLIVAVRMAANKPGHDDPVSRGGRGKVNPVKAAVIADAKAAGLDPSESTVKRAIAKAEGRMPAPKAKPAKRRSKEEIAADLHTHQMVVAEGFGGFVPIEVARHAYLLAAEERVVDFDSEREIIDDALRALDRKLNGGKSQSRASALPQDGRSEDSPL